MRSAVGGGFLYEFPKDLVAYGIMLAAFWLAARLDDLATAATANAAAAPPPVFDIRDGPRIVRAPVTDILAVRAVGNYAQFVLADGRRPMTRSSLVALEGQLAAHGFLRTHRSWLVNPSRVTSLMPEGSGDYAVELGSLRAPLSRRFPKALAALRGLATSAGAQLIFIIPAKAGAPKKEAGAFAPASSSGLPRLGKP